MPHFSLPISADGLIVQSVFGLNGPATAARAHAGQPIPRPIVARALLDCGADATAIAPHVFRSLGVAPTSPGMSQTSSGMVRVKLYQISLSIVGPGSLALTVPDLLVSELTVPLPNLDALIGMDVLRQCLFVMDGPGQQFILGF